MASEFVPTFHTADQAQTLDVSAVLELERKIAASGTSLFDLMNRAGLAVAMYVGGRLGLGTNVVVLAGTGNNGGDGWVAAELLSKMGARVTIACSLPPEGVTAQPARDAAIHAARFGNRASLSVLAEPSADDVKGALSQANIVIDALLGTGFAGTSLRGSSLEWIQLLADEQASRKAAGRQLAVIAVDAPSGVNAQTGAATDPCVRATATITMMAAKPGLLAEPGSAYVGQLLVARIFPLEQVS